MNTGYEVLSVTTLSGKTFWFACEENWKEGTVVTIGPSCYNKEDAETILKYFLED